MKRESNYTVSDSTLTLDGLHEHLVWIDIERLAETGLIDYPEFFTEELKEINLTPKQIITIV